MIAISSSTKKALIAVSINGKQGFRELDSNCKHAENILKELDTLLQELGLPLADNDCYGVVVGPGSFTGIRIAIALVKGFVMGGKEKIVSLTTFDLMAEAYIKSEKVKNNFVCVINALSGLYYICDYDSEGNRTRDARVISQQEFDNLQCVKVSLKEEGLSDKQVELSAEDLLNLALSKAEKGQFTDENNLNALYLRSSQAEENLNKKTCQNT